MNKFGRVSTAQLLTVNPVLKDLAYKTLGLSRVDFGILSTGGFRTAEQQKKLFDRGASQLDGTIKRSYHQTGNAVDFVPYIDGRYTWADIPAFEEIHKAVQMSWWEMGIEEYWLLTWGGYWTKFVDRPHYQIKKLKELNYYSI